MQMFTNNGVTTLANAVLAGDTTITVVDASKFPASNFKVTLETIDRSVNEIVLVTGVAGNVLTVTRAQEGTVASGFAVGSKVEVRVTAEFLNDLQGQIEGLVDAATDVTTALAEKANTIHSHAISDVTGLQTTLDGKAATTHTHNNATTSTDGFMSSADKTKLDGIATGANNYTHPTGDGNLHVPATGTTNNGKVLTAGATAGSLSWTAIPAAPVTSVAGKTGVVTLDKADVGLGNVDNTSDANKPVSTATQTALNAKQNTITGAATTITSSNLTASMAMVTDASGKIAAHGTVSATELGYLDGVTSAIQTQLNAKASSTHTHAISDVTNLQTTLDGKQGTLVSGTNIKTINGTSVLGSGNISIPTTTVNNTLTSTSTTEALSAANGKVLQDSKAPLASPALTGTPTAPTAAVGTNTTQLATTAFVNTEIANDAVLKTGATMTGAITSLRETIVAMPADAINLATGNFFTKKITAATTFTVSNVPTTGQAISFILELTNGGAATITWFSGVKWAGGTVPTLTASGVDILGFYSHDGGTTWRGILMSKDSK